MTPCYICGGGMEEVRLDPRDMKSKPCNTCEEIIQDAAFGKQKDEDGMTWGDYVEDLYGVSDNN